MEPTLSRLLGATGRCAVLRITGRAQAPVGGGTGDYCCPRKGGRISTWKRAQSEWIAVDKQRLRVNRSSLLQVGCVPTPVHAKCRRKSGHPQEICRGAIYPGRGCVERDRGGSGCRPVAARGAEASSPLDGPSAEQPAGQVALHGLSRRHRAAAVPLGTAATRRPRRVRRSPVQTRCAFIAATDSATTGSILGRVRRRGSARGGTQLSRLERNIRRAVPHGGGVGVRGRGGAAPGGIGIRTIIGIQDRTCPWSSEDGLEHEYDRGRGIPGPRPLSVAVAPGGGDEDLR